MAEQLLAGIKVLDLSEMVAGPYCTKLLADYGAEVIKVERPGRGDAARQAGPFINDDPHLEKSGLFLYLNTNKKSVTLDFFSPAGAAILRRLVKEVDVLVEDFSPGRLAEHGLGWPDLEKVNPRLVYTSITTFGQTGPYRDWKSVDFVPYAMGGWLQMTGETLREPIKTGGRIGEYVPGLFAAAATLSCLLGREISGGGGQQVDISALESIIPLAPYPTLASSYLGGHLFRRLGNRLATTCPFTILPCKDGYVGVITLTNLQWELLCQMMDIAYLLEDERLKSNPGRAANADLIDEAMKPWLLARTKEECFHEAQEWRIPFAIVPTAGDMPTLPQHQAREYFVEIKHPVAGPQVYPGAPFKVPEAPWAIIAPAPTLGQHNAEVLGALGYGKEALVQLTKMGII